MTIALVFAMTGGAYAAKKYLITSTKQISPKVLKALKGAAGRTGAAGPVGPSGKDGGQGSQGVEGKEGKTGAAGTTGKDGVTGKEGPTGKAGSPWTAGGTLPQGQTESGTWAYRGSTTNGDVGTDAISYVIPLTAAPEVEFVYAKATGTSCKGSASAPTAPEGFLCVYSAWEEEFDGKPITAEYKGTNTGETFNGTGSGLYGALLNFETKHIGESVLPFAVLEGTWAVTAS
ncbi:MAG TPA: hypothetical protein VFW38_11380 [Solirubrobacteraceae bacterium]|nr:hypothetical protein [Solirubrobacteraceae bacterium]